MIALAGPQAGETKPGQGGFAQALPPGQLVNRLRPGGAVALREFQTTKLAVGPEARIIPCH